VGVSTSERERPLLTIPEAAERLNLSTSTVRRRIWDGEIPAVRLGLGPQAPVRVDPDELEVWLHGARREPPAGGAGAPQRSPRGGLLTRCPEQPSSSRTAKP
jgi:excisionase family DNA binding protein